MGEAGLSSDPHYKCNNVPWRRAHFLSEEPIGCTDAAAAHLFRGSVSPTRQEQDISACTLSKIRGGIRGKVR